MQTTTQSTLKERRKHQKKWKLFRILCVLMIGILASCINVNTFGGSTTDDETGYYYMQRNTSNGENLSEIKGAAGFGVIKMTSEFYKLNSDAFRTETSLISNIVIPEPLTSIKETDKAASSEFHEGEEMYVPGYCGSVHPYMGWEYITDTTTAQYRLKQECESYDEYGFGKVGERYAVAMKPYYGDIGDYIDVIQTDGIEYHCIIVDHKGMENENKDGWLATYAHGLNDIVEFVVNASSWDGTEKTVAQYHPEFRRNIKTIYNVGNYWD